MTDAERQLLENTKSTHKTAEPKAPEPSINPEGKDLDVDALLKMHGLSSETNTKNPRTKWVLLIVMATVLVVFMFVISKMLSSFANS